MRRFLSITKKPIDQTKSLTTHWLTALSKIKDSLPTTMRRDQEKALVSKSDLASTLESLKGILLAEEQNYAGGIGPCLEYCLENKFFETLVSEAYLDRPKGVFQVVLRFLTGLVDGIRKQLLLPHRAFHGPVTDFLLYVSEHMKKGGEFDSAEMVNLLHAVACAVHINPSYATFFYRVCGARIEYMPLPILLTYFREESQCEQPKLRESLLLCTLLEDKEVVAHILRDTDIIQVLILKLGSYFQTLPQICNPGEPTDATGIEELRKYVTFLNSLCEQCLWKELLSEVGSVFQTIFCDGILSPRLQHSESGIRSTCTLYLTTLVRAVTSPVLLMPLVYYLRGKKPRDCMYLPTPRGRKSMPFEDDSGPMTPRTEVRLTSWSTLLENLDSRNEGLRLRSLQILYSLMEKRQWRILKTLFVESFRPSPTERPIRIKDFFQAYHGWMNEEAMNESYLQCHSYIFTSILSRNESYTRSRHSLVSTGETESTSKVREDTGGMYPAPYVECGELLTILIRKMKQLEGIFSLILAFPGKQIRPLQQFLLGSSNGSLGAALHMLNDKIRSQISEIDNFTEARQIAKEVHGPRAKDHPQHGVLRLKDPGAKATSDMKKVKNERLIDVSHIQAILVFEEFVNEVAGILLMQDQLTVLRDEVDQLMAAEG